MRDLLDRRNFKDSSLTSMMKTPPSREKSANGIVAWKGASGGELSKMRPSQRCQRDTISNVRNCLSGTLALALADTPEY
jgi:hypothetical protein